MRGATPSNPSEREHLDRLQRDSWNLELIISGLALFGLLAAGGRLENMMESYGSTGSEFWSIVYVLGMITVFLAGKFIFANLLVHLLLRGLWIGALGLRSVSGEIRFLKLKFPLRFDDFLRRRIGSFDHYINTLDKWCSLIFAFSFLSAMAMFGFFSFLAFLIVTVNFLRPFFGPSAELWSNLLVASFIFLYLMAGLIYFIDFITLGAVKRIRFFSRVYYVIYRFMSWITLARVYRPIYYNFIDDRFSRRVMFFAIPYISLVFFVFGINSNMNDYYNLRDAEALSAISGRIGLMDHYEDYRRLNEKETTAPLILPAEIITDKVLKIRMPYYPEYDEVIAEKCPDLPVIRGWSISTEFIDGLTKSVNLDSFKQADYLDCLIAPLRLAVDDQPIPLNDYVFQVLEDAPYPEFVKYLPLDSLNPGLHYIRLTTYKLRRRSDTLSVDFERTVPFYYQPDGR